MNGVILPLGLEEIRTAAEIIAAEAVYTPALTSESLDALADTRVVCKVESVQRAGSFKFRGAFHRLSLIPAAELDRGVVAVSSGNHGAAVACAAQILGISATVHVPTDIPAAKRSIIESFEAELITFDRSTPDREAPARAQAEATGATFVHPYEDRDVMLGQGTVALELHEQVRSGSLGALDVLLVPMSGGGLMAGCGSAMRQLTPTCELIGVEPATADDTARSFAAGRPIRIVQPRTIADGLALTQPGIRTFALNQHLVDDILVVSDERIVEAMRILRDTLDIRVEPSGAAALAAVTDNRERFQGRRIGVVLSGGNVSQDRYTQLLETGP